jgi:putative transcriptional regulator
MSFAFEIKNFRLSCLMNQTEFGDALGVSFTTVNRWENDKARPNIRAMKALKQYCEEHNLPYQPLEKSWRETKVQESA